MIADVAIVHGQGCFKIISNLTNMMSIVQTFVFPSGPLDIMLLSWVLARCAFKFRCHGPEVLHFHFGAELGSASRFYSSRWLAQMQRSLSWDLLDHFIKLLAGPDKL